MGESCVHILFRMYAIPLFTGTFLNSLEPASAVFAVPVMELMREQFFIYIAKQVVFFCV